MDIPRTLALALALFAAGISGADAWPRHRTLYPWQPNSHTGGRPPHHVGRPPKAPPRIRPVPHVHPRSPHRRPRDAVFVRLRAPRRPAYTVSPWVVRVHDGDTFYVGAETIRLRGLDAPELGQANAGLATARLVALLREGPVTIVPRAEDVYGRTLADVYVGGRDVAALLRREGFDKPRKP